MPYEDNNKYSAIIIGISIVILLWLAHIYSFFSISNGYSYDLLTRIYPSAKASDQVIVIEIDSSYDELGDEIWLKLVKQLINHDIKQIAFPFFPTQVSEQFFQFATDSKKVVFGSKVKTDPENPSVKTLSLPDNATAENLLFGLIAPIPNQHGVFREQNSVIKINESEFPVFELQVAKQVLDKADTLPASNFLVNFIGNKNRIPRLNAQRILTGGLINELVSGRTALVGIINSQYTEQYFTPVSTGQQLTSKLMFHAFALDTLLSDRQIKLVPGWAFILQILTITGITLFICQWLTFQMSMTVSIIATTSYLIICWIALHAFYISIPLTELLLAQWISFALVWRYRVDQENQSLDQVIFGLSLKLREKVNPVSFYHTDEPWNQLIELLNQSLDLHRLIFLERVQGDHRLKEIKALNCSIDDIAELRRDYERLPYSRAISENRPVLLDRVYLKETEVAEEQYLAPLIFAGEILGFWAFTVKANTVKASDVKFHALTQAFMVQISEILHYRQEWQRQTQKNQNKLLSYLRVEGGSTHLQELNKSVALLDKRGFELHEVFNNINTHCILYDLFGRVLLVNQKMEVMTQQSGLLLFNMTMLDFIVEMTGYDPSSGRQLIQKIIFDHESASIPFNHPIMGQSFMLHLRPLQYQEDKTNEQWIPDESRVFQISGVLCELVDMTELRNLYQLKEKMFERFSFRLRKDLNSILFSLPKLAGTQFTNTEQQSVLNKMDKKIVDTLEILSTVNEQMAIEIEHMLTNHELFYPVDGTATLKKSISALQETIEKREIKMHLDLPGSLSYVFASPMELEVIFHTILTTLIADTYQAGEIWIKAEEKNQSLIYQVHNTGIGISDIKLQQFEDSDVTHEPETIKFHSAIETVSRWNGSLGIKSQMGEGSVSELMLKVFL